MTAPLSREQVVAVCQKVVDAVNVAVAHQFALPPSVLQHLVSCQTDALRARFAASQDFVAADTELVASLARFQRAAAALGVALERRRK